MGFSVGRGRGYRPEQVDRRLAALSGERDAAWERAARLTVLAKEMEAEAARLRTEVAALAPQRYESLGERARKILELAEQEEHALVTAAEAAAQRTAGQAGSAAARTAEAARVYADGVRAEAESTARETLRKADGEAEAIRAHARRAAEGERGAAHDDFEEATRRSATLLAGQEREQAAVREEAERVATARAAALDARHEELVISAEARVADARRALTETEEQSRHGQEDAEARAAELLAEARLHEERTERETERILREHEEAREEIHARMNHIRTALATLTGRPNPEPDKGEQAAKDDEGD
ncbi:cellulose-binding protein [Streptomyces sp. NPDC003035]|uniref:cellulose-binding protein n=1 Tax=Streptomyces sp. NPDC003035 TaxID=3364676 RepID=UPI00368B4F56